MKFGVVFPQTEIGNDPLVIRDFAQAIEDMNCDYLLAYEHVVGANPNRPGGWTGIYTHKDAFHEPFVLFGYLATITKRLVLVTGILVLPQRQTALVAKQAAEADSLSGGRLQLGIGVGWNEVEFQALGANFGTRGKRVEEQIAVLRELWTKPLVTYRGEYHILDEVGIHPLPVQRPIPIWIGGVADVVLQRAARLADGWLPPTAAPEDSQAMAQKLRHYLDDEGRDQKSFGISARLSLSKTPEQEWGKYIQGWRKLGASHMAVNTMNLGLKTPQEHIEAIRRFKAEVGT